MKTDYAGSARSSATTSTSGPKASAGGPKASAGGRKADAPRADETLSEAEFLEKQAHDAQAAISKVLQDLKAKVGQGVDPKAWAREHPWIAVGAAAVAGFAATSALV